MFETSGCGDLEDSGWFRALHAERVDDAAREIILNSEAECGYRLGEQRMRLLRNTLRDFWACWRGKPRSFWGICHMRNEKAGDQRQLVLRLAWLPE